MRVTFFLFLLMLCSPDIFGWEELLRVEEANTRVVVEFDEDASLVRIKYKPMGSWSLFKKGPSLSIDSPTSVDTSLALTREFLVDNLGFAANSGRIKNILERIEEFKYLSKKECRALHFDLDGQVSNSAPIKTLLDQVNKIRLAQSPGEEAFRSIKVNTFLTSHGPIQLRIVLGKDGEFLKFSFARSQGSLINFDWQLIDGVVTLRSPEKDVLLEIDTKSFSSEGGLITAKSATDERLEEEVRSFFRLSHVVEGRRHKWYVVPYETEHFSQSVIKSGVPLTTGIANHTPIIQLREKEIVFKRLALEEIEKLDILRALDEGARAKLENHYNQCMGERLSFISEEQRFSNDFSTGPETDQSRVCIRKTQAEALGRLLGFPEQGKLSLYRSCLKEKKIAQIQSSFFSFNEESLIEMPSELYEGFLMDCFRKEKEEMLALSLREKIMKSAEFKELLPGEKAIELLADEIVGPYQESCLKVVQVARIEDCRLFADHMIKDEIFNTLISSRLISMKGLMDNSFEVGTKKIIAPLEKCQSERNERMKKLFSENNQTQTSLEGLNEARVDCAKKAIIEFSGLVDNSFFSAALIRSGLSVGDNPRSEEELTEMRASLKACWTQFISEEDILKNLVEDIDYHLEACLPSVLKDSVAKMFMDEFTDVISEYTPFRSKGSLEDLEGSESVKGKVALLIDQELQQWRELDQLDKVRVSLRPKLISTLYTHHTWETIKDLSSEDENLKGDMEEVVRRIIGASSNDDLDERSLVFFSRQPKNVENGYVMASTIALRESLKRFYLESSEVISRSEALALLAPIRPQHQDGEVDQVVIDLGVRGREAFNQCFEQYASNSSESLDKSYFECEKKRFGRIKLQVAITANERRVASLMPLSSLKANNILASNQYLGECFKKVDPFKSQSLTEYKNSLSSCVSLAEFDISMSLALAQVESFKAISQLGDERKEQAISCFSKIISETTKVSSDRSRILIEAHQEARERSPLGGGLLSLLPGAHVGNATFSPESAQVVTELISGSLFDGQEKSVAWKSAIKACEDRTDALFKGEFREYVIRSIPSLDLVDREDPNTQLMRDFLDVELVELIMEFQKVNEAKLVGSRIQITESSLENRMITSDLGMSMLVNFVELLGDLIGKGFIYDEAAMRTELVVFQSELKGFLRWYSSNAEMVSIEQAQDFFQESKLSEHLSMAVVSEKTFESFLIGISEMRKRELNDLFSGKSCFDSERCLGRSDRQKLRALNKRFDELRELSREMTSSYDFRRIIRPETSEGQEIIEAIKDSYLMPKALGRRMNARAEESMMKIIGEAILRDNTDGGFADRFVHVMAQAELDKEKERRWGITEWMFFDEKDFDWDRLKETDAGQSALDYYARFIMLPEAMGRPLGRYELRLRKDQFRRLITAAQKQNTQ